MRVRIGLTALLVATLGISALVVVSPVAASNGAPVPSQVEPVTVSGEFEHLVIDARDGPDLRYAVRGADETWWLEGVAEPAPAAGSQVIVTGTPVDRHTLAVETITVTPAAEAMSRTEALAPGSTRVIVLRAFWTRRAPAQPTKRATFRRVIRGSNGWFQEVSHRRYSITGAVTPWLRVPRPDDCVNDGFQVMNQALTAAQRRGFDLSRFQRAILYMPCDAGGLLGFATVPGQHVWLFNTLALNVVVHEQGHNLGLYHASSRECLVRRMVVTWKPRCRVFEYGDSIDTMGNRRPGHFNGFYKTRLGWLQRGSIVRSTRIVTLRPAETTGPGLKAVRVRAGTATYWLEYRRRIGYDRSMLRGTQGLQIRYQNGRRKTQLLDAGPGSTAGVFEIDDAHLPAGSSWTTPQNVRIAVLRQRPLEVTVRIKFRAGPARAPGRPSPVWVEARDDAARIVWTRPTDNGSIIRRYVITRDDGTSRTIKSFAGLRRSYVWPGLDQTRTYWFAVRAVNQVGRSRAAISPAVQPR